jgi:hypothetical protein
VSRKTSNGTIGMSSTAGAGSKLPNPELPAAEPDGPGKNPDGKKPGPNIPAGK